MNQLGFQGHGFTGQVHRNVGGRRNTDRRFAIEFHLVSFIMTSFQRDKRINKLIRYIIHRLKTAMSVSRLRGIICSAVTPSFFF